MPPRWMGRGPRGPLPRLHPLTPANTGGSVNPRSRGLPAAHIGGPLRAKLESIHPVLMSRDVSASVRFYTRLGFSMTFQDRPIDPQYAGVLRDGVELHLQWQAESQWAYPIDRPTYRIRVQEVDALYAELRD